MAEPTAMLPRILAEGLTLQRRHRHLVRLPLRGPHRRRARVLDLARALRRRGRPPRSASATPPAWPTRAQVEGSSPAPSSALPGVELTAHFHNTRGQGLANAVAALDAGCTSFESSFGELGGCPVPPGSTGNIATEDLVSMFHEMGVETGVDLEA